jgi:hypothetical protein
MKTYAPLISKILESVNFILIQINVYQAVYQATHNLIFIKNKTKHNVDFYYGIGCDWIGYET